MSIEFKNLDNSVTVYTYGSGIAITARMGRDRYADVALPKKDAPAFALAVLKAAGYVEGIGKDWGSPFQLDAIRSLKDYIQQQEQAAEASALGKEAEALARAFHGVPITWATETPQFRDLWLRMARAARELHKPGASK